MGANGFVGSALVKSLTHAGANVSSVTRDNIPPKGARLGTLFYCIGLTADFRSNLLATAESHVSILIKTIRDYQFERLIYLSSTRVYSGNENASESTKLVITPTDPFEVYNLSKLTGESIVAALGPRRGISVRLSNVLGPSRGSSNFVYDICRQAHSGRIVLRTPAEARRDYIHIDDVARLLVHVATDGQFQLYNLAYGRSISNGEIVGTLKAMTGCEVDFLGSEPPVTFPEIDVSRINSEFGAGRLPPLDCLQSIIDTIKQE